MRVRTVRAWPSSEKWSADAVAEIRATPERPNPHNAKQKFVEAERNTEGMLFSAKPKHEAAEAKPKREAAEHQEGQSVKDIRDFRILLRTSKSLVIHVDVLDATLKDMGFQCATIRAVPVLKLTSRSSTLKHRK